MNYFLDYEFNTGYDGNKIIKENIVICLMIIGCCKLRWKNVQDKKKFSNLNFGYFRFGVYDRQLYRVVQ